MTRKIGFQVILFPLTSGQIEHAPAKGMLYLKSVSDIL